MTSHSVTMIYISRPNDFVIFTCQLILWPWSIYHGPMTLSFLHVISFCDHDLYITAQWLCHFYMSTHSVTMIYISRPNDFVIFTCHLILWPWSIYHGPMTLSFLHVNSFCNHDLFITAQWLYHFYMSSHSVTMIYISRPNDFVIFTCQLILWPWSIYHGPMTLSFLHVISFCDHDLYITAQWLCHFYMSTHSVTMIYISRPNDFVIFTCHLILWPWSIYHGPMTLSFLHVISFCDHDPYITAQWLYHFYMIFFR